MAIGGGGIFRDVEPSLRKSINTGYILVPDNVERAKFVENCLRTERFSILVEDGGGVLHNCYITKSALRDIKFPTGANLLGSGVTFFTEPHGGKAIITGVVGLDSEQELHSEDVIVFKKTKDGNFALVSVDGNGQVTIDIIGTSSKGKLNINVRNDDFSAEVNVNVKGNVNVSTQGSISLIAIDGSVNVVTNDNVEVTLDGDCNITAGGDINIDSTKFNLHEANEAMVRGDELQTQIDKTNDIVQAIKDSFDNWTPVPKDGGAALKALTTANLTGKIMGDFKDIKSEKSFLE
jgi:hypothetical protein